MGMMKLITERRHGASIYEVFSYGRHNQVYMVTSRIEGLKDYRSTVVKGLKRDAAIQAARDEADLARIMYERGGIARSTARIYLHEERCNTNHHTSTCAARSAGTLNDNQYCGCYCHGKHT